MSRLAAAIGSGIGAGAGMVVGAAIGPRHYQGMTKPDSELFNMTAGAVLGAATGAALGAGSSAPPQQVGTSGVGKLVPAQASGHDFVTDWPIAGPTDEGLRAADCWWMQNRLPVDPACVDCKKASPPMAAGVSGATDPAIWITLSYDQQKWVSDTLTKLNDLIVKTTGTKCASWSSAITNATACFQNWFNSAYKGATAMTGPGGQAIVLRTDGVFDQDTLNALITVAGLNPKDFPTPYPQADAVQKKGFSTGEMVGIAAASAAALGGIVWVATRKKKHRRR